MTLSQGDKIFPDALPPQVFKPGQGVTANTGISGFVDPLGRYHEKTRLFEEAVRTWDVPLTSERTVYDRVGDVVAWEGLLLLATATVAAAARREARHAPADCPPAQSPDLGAVS